MTVVLVCDFNCVKMTVLAHCQGRPFCFFFLGGGEVCFFCLQNLRYINYKQLVFIYIYILLS